MKEAHMQLRVVVLTQEVEQVKSDLDHEKVISKSVISDLTQQVVTLAAAAEKAPEDVDDEKSAKQDDPEFQQESPFPKKAIWHADELFHDLELKTGPSKRNEMQVAFCKGLYNRHLAEMKVLVHQLMREQDKSRKKGKGKRNREGNEKSGAV